MLFGRELELCPARLPFVFVPLNGYHSTKDRFTQNRSKDTRGFCGAIKHPMVAKGNYSRRSLSIVRNAISTRSDLYASKPMSVLEPEMSQVFQR